MKEVFNHVDTLIFSTSEDHVNENFYYAAGLSKTKHVSAIILASKKGKIIITNKLEHGLFSGRKIIVDDRKQLQAVLNKHTGRHVGMDFSRMSAHSLGAYRKMLKNRKIIDIAQQMGEVRSVKTNSEIAKIKQGCKITEDTFAGLSKMLAKSRTEKELALELDYAARRNGAEAIAFPTIVASGVNSALPHHSPTDKKLSGLLLIDFGVVYDGYCSDLTRTFFMGRADKKAQNVYRIVKKAQNASMTKIQPGVSWKDVHKEASDIIKKELGQELIHSVGHGLGIEVHDYPISNSTLKENMVMTVEPGYYDVNWGGIRIEDDFVVGKKAVSLSKSPSDLQEV